MPQPPPIDLDGPPGLKLLDRDPEGALRAEMALEAEHRRPDGGVRVGLYAALAEALAVAGTRAGAAGAPGGQLDLLSCHLSLLDRVDTGSIRIHARPRHRGRTTWVWEVECRSLEGRPAAAARVTVAIRS